MGRPKGALQKSPKKTKKTKDPNKPKRSTSAYFFFLAACRKEAKASGRSISKIAEFTKECSVKWKALPQDKRVPFDEAAAKDKERYDEEMQGYKGKGGGKAATKDPNKPKKAPTAYFLFLADFRVKMAGRDIPHKELLVKAGEEWRNMSADKKKPYEKGALAESRKYEEAMTQYRKNGGGAAPPKVQRVEPEDDMDEDDEEEEEEEEDEEEEDDEDDDDE